MLRLNFNGATPSPGRQSQVAITLVWVLLIAGSGCAIRDSCRRFVNRNHADAATLSVDRKSATEPTNIASKHEDVHAPAIELSAWAEPTVSLIAPPVSPVASPVSLVEPIADDRMITDYTEPALAVQPIDLGAALAMTAGQNPEVNFARQRIAEAFAQLQSAETLWLPSIRAGANYNKHEGRIQDVAGQIIETSRGSVYTGLGAQAVGAGSPAVPGLLMNFHLSDAIFQPRIAGQTVAARRQASRAVSNDLLLATAVAYVDLLEAMQIKAVAEQSLENATRLADLANDFAETGEGLQSDADRARTELSFRTIDVRKAEEVSRVASVRLSRLLHADQNVTLVPVEPLIVAIEMVKLHSPLRSMVSTGLETRPELYEAKHLVREATERLKREKCAPLVPSLLLGMSYGGNGGGLNGDIDRFGDRMDFDAAAWWEVRNLGYGEKAARDAACSRVEQTKWQQIRTMDTVSAEIAEAHAEVTARRDQITLAQTAILSAEASYRQNTARIRDGQGLPIEVLQSIQALDEARRAYVRIIADYNRSQFRLQRALGWPVDAEVQEDADVQEEVGI